MAAVGFGPSLALRRTGVAIGAFDFTGGVLPAGASLTRSSVGMRTNAAGVLVGEGVDVPRFDHEAGVPVGLLLEPARINVFSYADQFDNAAWNKMSVTVTANDRVAPDGTVSADRLVMAGGGVVQRTGVGAAGATISGSMWLYVAATVSGMLFGLYDNVAGGQYATITLEPGVWTRIMATRAFGAGASDRRLQLAAPSGGATIWAWGGQGETAGTVTSYVPTVAAAAGRAADMLTLALPVADGPASVRMTFDDLSTQDVVLSVAGGNAAVPAAVLNRPRVRRIDRL